MAERDNEERPRRDPFGLDIGEDPDPRFSYANERTFLAWCRTALGLMTAGLAITQLLPPFDFPGGRRLIGIPLIIAGTVLAGGSFVQWARNERAMRLGRPLPRSILLPGVAAVVAVTSLIALAVVVLDALGDDDAMVREDANNPSLAAERTALAWQRSGLSLAAIGAVIAKGVPPSGVSHRPVVGAIAVALGLALMAVAASFEHRRRRQPVRPIATWVDLATLAIPTTIAGVVLLAVVAWPV